MALGGSTTFLCNLGGELIRRGIICRVFADESENPLAADFQRRAIPVTTPQDWKSIFEDRLEVTLGALRDFQPTVVVAALMPFEFEILRYLPAGIQRIAMAQSDDPNVYANLEKYAAHMDLLVGVSAAIVARLEEMAALDRVFKCHLPYGITMPEQTAPRAKPGEPLRILFLGRLANEQKRVFLFPQILAALQKSGIPFQWTIAGDGPERAAIEPQMRTRSIHQRVEFVGLVPYSDISRVLDAHDVFLLTSDYEGLPLSLLEAMGHSLVPVTSELKSGVGEVVNANNGMLVPVNDVEGYARAIIHLHEHREELAAKSLAARERVGVEFSVKAMTDRWLKIFPEESEPDIVWPQHWQIKPLLVARHPLYFSPPMRVLRRLAIKFRR
jgi:glycosyltransferase involved in cell wall biosynthesis